MHCIVYHVFNMKCYCLFFTKNFSFFCPLLSVFCPLPSVFCPLPSVLFVSDCSSSQVGQSAWMSISSAPEEDHPPQLVPVVSNTSSHHRSPLVGRIGFFVDSSWLPPTASVWLGSSSLSSKLIRLVEHRDRDECQSVV